MKKTLNYMLMAVLTVGLSLTATSCKDDDKDNGGGEPTAEEIAVEHAETFWAVAANLVSPFDVTAEYKNKTFEPTIGEAQEGSSTVRVVVVPDAEAAAAHFAAMVDADVKESTTTYTYQNDAVGTLTYTKSTDGKSLAKVDVSIQQIPHLQQIVYKTQEQMGTNAVTDGVPYYSFGDVISRTREDGVKEYWMCIQAPFTKQGETSAVWASVSQLPKENIWSYTASNNYTYKVPTKLGNNKEYMKNLAEMLYAIMEPENWEKNLTDGPKDMKAFNLVKKENVKYINRYFWERVQRGWKEKQLAETIFGVEDMENIGNALNDNDQGLKLLYHGYSWHTLWSNELTLYESTITKGDGMEANARHLTWQKVTKDVINPDKIEVNCVTQLQKGSQWVNTNFFPKKSEDDEPRYCFRFATTKELAGIEAFRSMNYINDIEDVYVYTKKYDITVGERQKMDSTIVTQDNYNMNFNIRANEVKVGYYLCADGKFCETRRDADNNHRGAVAVVAYLGGNSRVEKGKDWNGLAIALWDEICSWSKSTDYDACPGLEMIDIYYAEKECNGMAATEILAGGCGNLKHEHPAAKYCHDYDVALNNREGAISSWFMPSLGQWVLAMEGLGGEWKNGHIVLDAAKMSSLNLSMLTKSTGDGCQPFWSTSVGEEKKAYYFQNDHSFGSTLEYKTHGQAALPFIAFKYDNGGTQEPNFD